MDEGGVEERLREEPGHVVYQVGIDVPLCQALHRSWSGDCKLTHSIDHAHARSSSAASQAWMMDDVADHFAIASAWTIAGGARCFNTRLVVAPRPSAIFAAEASAK